MYLFCHGISIFFVYELDSYAFKLYPQTDNELPMSRLSKVIVTCIQTDRQTDRQTNRQTDRQLQPKTLPRPSRVVIILYLAHIIINDLRHNKEYEREIRNMFVRCNIFTRKLFYNCVLQKSSAKLFRSVCFCFFTTDRRTLYKSEYKCVQKFNSSCNKCAKMFFWF